MLNIAAKILKIPHTANKKSPSPSELPDDLHPGRIEANRVKYHLM